ncbi:UNVERIFIED_CONTAM: hypothetical protein GTU68_041151 [Idotea baltica]|nr:hypothetical protein [Idotea baltica]
MEQLSEIDALIIPGGESSALLKLLDNEFREGLKSTVSGGLPTLATCAGAILLANQVSNPKQDSLQLLDISIIRNDYGRQINSFIASNLTKTGTEILPGIFIRAPKISEVEDNVDILATHEDSAVLIKQDNILVATFHPELNTKNYPIHQLLLSLVK